MPPAPMQLVAVQELIAVAPFSLPVPWLFRLLRKD
jgi:hypothetical protein